MAAVRHPDVEGEILAAIRQRIGRRMPLVATLDLHANVTPQMVRETDALVTYHCMPHVDIYETGERGAAVLRQIIDGARPVTAFQKVPAVVPPQRQNTEAASGVSVDLRRQLKELESDERVLSAGLATVQPWMDIPELGSSALVVADGDPEWAMASCKELATEFWQRRHEYLSELVSIEDAVRQAYHSDGLVVLSDPSDATTSGAPGDSVWILRELLQYDWPRPVLVTLVAPEIVARAEDLGPAAQLEVELGGVRDTCFGTRMEMACTVERLFDARFTMTGHVGKNMPINMGRSAVLRKGNVVVIVSSRTGPHFAPEFFQAAGYDPFAASVLVAKSPSGFRAAYEGKSSEIYSVAAPGCAPSDFWKYPFKNIPRPMWPWDEIDDWQPTPSLVDASRPSIR